MSLSDKQQQSNLIFPEGLAESLIEAINVWVNVCDTELNIRVWNQAAESISGYAAADVIGHRKVWEWLYPDEDYLREVLAMTEVVLTKDGNLHDFETQILSRDKQVKVITWYSRPLVDPDNTIRGFVTFGYDSTERKLEQQALRKAHNELHVLYEIASIANAVTDLNEILECSLERILPVMKSARGAIHLWNTDNEALEVATAIGIDIRLFSQLDAIMDVFVKDTPVNVIVSAALSKRFRYLGVPMRTKAQGCGVISILANADTTFSSDDVALLSSIAAHIGIAVENIRLNRQSQQLAVAEARRRLARDLHDSVTQSLYSLPLFAEAGQRLLRSGEIDRVENILETLNKTALDALKEMRMLLYELRPLAFQPGKLVETLQERLDAVERRSGLRAHLITTSLPHLPPRVEENLYHIALEALNNALKHALATAVTVELHADAEHVQLRVSDNGTGFDCDQIKEFGGMGLPNMRERTEELNGCLDIQSSTKSGTVIRVKIPTNNF
ncbi:MAG: PAS domain S-box protein [Chloroflexi bacterium]|nr:MAG: hypothetical protein CUN54_05005 [Phototrophicales bacterium]RMF78364.1 MAG: PAS domain S-box protein [Chloroflexota bacterium]